MSESEVAGVEEIVDRRIEQLQATADRGDANVLMVAARIAGMKDVLKVLRHVAKEDE